MNRLHNVSRILNILIIGSVAVAAIASLIFSAPHSTDMQASRLEAIIKKASVQCYALEGAYPDDVFYLKNYGVIFDTDRFYFHYELYGISNYMPEIYVIPR